MAKSVFKKLPRKVKIKKVTYPIEFVEDLQDREGELWGCFCRGDEPKIWICKASRKNMESTIIHELIHALASHYNIYQITEKKVLRLEKALYETFVKNGWKICID